MKCKLLFLSIVNKIVAARQTKTNDCSGAPEFLGPMYEGSCSASRIVNTAQRHQEIHIKSVLITSGKFIYQTRPGDYPKPSCLDVTRLSRKKMKQRQSPQFIRKAQH